MSAAAARRLARTQNARTPSNEARLAGPGSATIGPVMNPFSHICAVTFDVGGTLIEPWPSVGHVYAEVAARHGVNHADPAVLNRQFTAAWRGRKNFNYTRTDWADLVDQTFVGLSDVLPSRTFFPE